MSVWVDAMQVPVERGTDDPSIVLLRQVASPLTGTRGAGSVPKKTSPGWQRAPSLSQHARCPSPPHAVGAETGTQVAAPKPPQASGKSPIGTGCVPALHAGSNPTSTKQQARWPGPPHAGACSPPPSNSSSKSTALPDIGAAAARPDAAARVRAISTTRG